MRAKTHKPSARFRRDRIACLGALSLTSLLAALAFSATAHAAGPIKVAAQSLRAGAAQSHAKDLPPAAANASVASPPSAPAVGAGAWAPAAVPAPAQPTGAASDSQGPTETGGNGAWQTSRPGTTPSSPTAAAATNSLARSGADPAHGTLLHASNLARANALANVRSARAIGVTRATHATTAAGALVIAAHRVARLRAPAGEAARAPTAGTPPARMRVRVTADAPPRARVALSGLGRASMGTPEALAAAAEAPPGLLQGARAPASLLLPALPGLPGTVLPITASRQLAGPAAAELPAPALSGRLAAYPAAPALVGSSAGGWLSGGVEAGLPSSLAPAWASPALKGGIGSAQPSGLLGCMVGSAGELLATPCDAARSRLLGQGGSFLVGVDALAIPSRRPPPDRDAIGVSYTDAPAGLLAGSPSGAISGGSSSSAAAGLGFALTTLMMPAALLLLVGPRIVRRLSLVCEKWLATAFALIPERPG